MFIKKILRLLPAKIKQIENACLYLFLSGKYFIDCKNFLVAFWQPAQYNIHKVCGVRDIKNS